MLEFFKKEMIKKVIKNNCLVSACISKNINDFKNIKNISDIL